MTSLNIKPLPHTLEKDPRANLGSFLGAVEDYGATLCQEYRQDGAMEAYNSFPGNLVAPAADGAPAVYLARPRRMRLFSERSIQRHACMML